MVSGCLRFNGSPSLLQREPKTFSALTATGAPLGPDNLFHIKLTDKFKDMKRLGQPCGSAVSNKSMDNPGGGSRPVLTVQPEEAARPGDAGVPPPVGTPPTPPAGGSGSGSAAPPPPPPPPGPEPTGSAPPPPGAGGSANPPPPPPAEGPR